MTMAWRAALFLALTSVPVAASAQQEVRPAYPPVLPLRERAAVIDGWLRERLDTVLPAIMREQGVDMWVLVARENFEEPVIASMLDAESMAARRRTILVFFDSGEGLPFERLTVSRYPLGDLFEADWDPHIQPDQWKRLTEIIAVRNPKRIAINSSRRTAYADGMTLSAHDEMMAALPESLRSRVVRDETLAVRWLETRTAAEMARYPQIVALAHAIIGEGLSDKVITPGVTTTDDVVWWFRERIAALKLDTWFQPSVAVSRRGVKDTLDGDTVIAPGDLIWTDFGIEYLRLHTDTQQNAYVLRPGETQAPKGLRDGLAANNRVQDALTTSFRVGDSGNAILARARAKAIAQGLNPSIYSHPIGYHGHGAGTAIGFWDNQQPDPRGDYPLYPNTAWSIELAATAAVPEWGGQLVSFKTEEDAYYDGSRVTYLDGRQTDLYLLGGTPTANLKPGIPK
ncbi:M24 family metallopeptidase [Sphingomonas qomolangmaensis]|uniref:M24 family metallopeptidase n=1 Tax=Sphingomonas qomolangmaensis TaxID=2918765 RepID=A0ABY5LBN2_9SPHN|nr:M24 family metallopeptidase [Sphingomonas qomolangmaensis]UUL83267.1 M24 family metallopeptidase [Sphingomonas qomolangmaensis]